jgi:uncharacterized protein (TIGR02147 family)
VLLAEVAKRARLHDAKKASKPQYSHRLFARQAGLASSALLSNVIAQRRNLSAHTTEAFIKAMKLPAQEAHFFRLLVDLDQAKNDEDRNEAWQLISACRRFREARQIEGESFRYLSHWYYPAIRELAACNGFQASPAWIAKALRPRITQAQAARALEALVTLGMLVPDEEGQLIPADASVVTPMEVAGLAVHNYHSGMLLRATDAISAFDPEHRYLGGLTVSIPASLVDTLKDELKDLQSRLLDLCDSAPAPAEHVYQLNLQLFPLSAPPKGDPE